MGIKIKKIAVKNLGPIQDFSHEFGLLNLIYSRNECGKTFLTEFMTRSLFKNVKRWQFRENGTGRVIVSGLNGKGDVEFSPGSAQKLEDYWEKDEKGLPLSLVKLLVSKGGEASIENSEGGIGKSLIKEIFSGISLLDRIDSDSNISRTVKNAVIEGPNITISNAGEGKVHRQLKEQIEVIDRLFADIESKYSKGIVESLKSDENTLKSRLDNLNNAKRHKAYLISQKIRESNKELKQNDDDLLSIISADINMFNNKKGEYERKEEKLKELGRDCSNFEWLSKAVSAYEKFAITSVKRPGIAIPVLAALFALVAIVISLLNIPPFWIIIPIVIAAGLAAFYIARLAGSSKNAGFSEEMKKLKREFKNRTGKELTDIAALNAELERQKASYDRSGLLVEQLEQERTDKQVLFSSIQQRLNELTGGKIAELDWISVLNEKKGRNRTIRDEIDNLREEQTDLGVRETEYLPEDPKIPFSFDEFEKITNELEDIQESIDEKNQEAETLKYVICNETGDDPTTDWDILIDNLRNKRIDIQKDFDILEAQITAGVLVHEVVSSLREEEDNKIDEGLKSEVVLKPLMEVTSNYNRLSLVGEDLVVSDDYNNFCIRDLSTGAREQIMLALRIGFASKILKQDTLFLILDDAFQHSDWQRRKTLVKKLADIALSGWQVIYLSMDDHIKELFDNAGSEFKKGEYRCIELAR